MQLAENIFCLAHGKLLANGSPEEIKNDEGNSHTLERNNV